MSSSTMRQGHVFPNKKLAVKVIERSFYVVSVVAERAVDVIL